MNILKHISAYYRLIFPAIPDITKQLDENTTKYLVKELARGNPSLQVGKYATKAQREKKKTEVCRYSFS